ncbi:MAG: DUF4251 domain-containing protein [Bacteroidales bacterium]|nr:DUF4251 domain-containing protein [Bacteroidales bacterium]
MKKSVYWISMLLMALFLSVQTAAAQNSQALSKKEKRHIEHLRKIKERNMQRAASRSYYMELLKNRYFVFQADYVIGPNGASFGVSPDINFFSLNGNKTTLQFGLNGQIGFNGLGGVTTTGTIQNFKFNAKSKKNMEISGILNLQQIDPGLPPHINLFVADDGTGELDIRLASGNIVTLYGQIVSPKKARTFVGHNFMIM